MPILPADCTTLVCEKPLGMTLVLIIGVAYILCASAGARIAAKLGRNERTWTVYGFCVPFVPYFHARWLRRKAERGDPLDS